MFTTYSGEQFRMKSQGSQEALYSHSRDFITFPIQSPSVGHVANPPSILPQVVSSDHFRILPNLQLIASVKLLGSRPHLRVISGSGLIPINQHTSSEDRSRTAVRFSSDVLLDRGPVRNLRCLSCCETSYSTFSAPHNSARP